MTTFALNPNHRRTCGVHNPQKASGVCQRPPISVEIKDIDPLCHQGLKLEIRLKDGLKFNEAVSAVDVATSPV